MKDFEEIRREEVITEIANGADIFAFMLKMDARKSVTYRGYRLRDEKLGVIQNLIANPNVVFFKKREEAVEV